MGGRMLRGRGVPDSHVNLYHHHIRRRRNFFLVSPCDDASDWPTQRPRSDKWAASATGGV